MSTNRNAYDSYAVEYHEKRASERDNLWNLYLDRPMIEQLLGEPPPGTRTLDRGCGSGLLTRHLQEQGLNVKGVDFSSRLVDIARADNPTIEFSISDVASTPFEEAEFEIIVSGLVMHYVQDLIPVFAEAHRVLAPHGLFIFTMHHPFNEVLEIACDRNGYSATMRPYFHNHQYTWTMLEGMHLVSYHHTFDCISRGLSQTGFAIERLAEAQAPETVKDRYPQFYARTNAYPSFCGFRARRLDNRVCETPLSSARNL